MTFKHIGKSLIGRGLPFLGSLLGGKAGESAGEAVASLLGVENKPDRIMAALDKDPQAAVRLKELETQLALAEIDRDKAEIAHDTASEGEAARTIRVEASSSDPYVRRTRPMIMRNMFYLTAVIALAVIGMSIFSTPEKIAAVKPMLMELFNAAATLCGVMVSGYTLSRMREKNTAVNPRPGMLQTLVAGIRAGKNNP